MAPDPGERLVVGRIGRAHGLRGEVAVTFTTNREERSTPARSSTRATANC